MAGKTEEERKVERREERNQSSSTLAFTHKTVYLKQRWNPRAGDGTKAVFSTQEKWKEMSTPGKIRHSQTGPVHHPVPSGCAGHLLRLNTRTHRERKRRGTRSSDCERQPVQTQTWGSRVSKAHAATDSSLPSSNTRLKLSGFWGSSQAAGIWQSLVPQAT